MGGLTLGCALRQGLVAGLLLLAACSPTRHGELAGAAEALEARQAGFLAALSAGHLDGLADFFAAEAVLQVANRPPVQGRDAILEFYSNVFRFMVAAEYTLERQALSAAGDLAVSSGSVTTVFAGREGQTEFPGKFVLAWQHIDGEWQVLLYGVSNNR